MILKKIDIYCNKCKDTYSHRYNRYENIPDVTEKTGYVYAYFRCNGCNNERLRVEHINQLEKIVENKK